ncbi:MAG: cobalt ECF transporter T component CbiQ [Lentisphaerota bacterium]
MPTIAESLNNIRLLDELSGQATPVHRLHPLAKLLTTLAFIVVTVSFGKYDLSAMLPLIIYPAALMIAGDIPFAPLFKRMLIISPLAIGLGIFNPLFDREPLIMLPWLQISGGWVSFTVIMLKFALTALAALILVATTGITGIACALRTLRMPRIFVMQLILTYRYIALLLEEVASILLAYSLRAPFSRGVHFGAWGSLSGQLLIKTHLRAQRVYDSMLCRGFAGEYNTGGMKRFSLLDLTYSAGFTLFFIVVRTGNIPVRIGALITDLYSIS